MLYKSFLLQPPGSLKIFGCRFAGILFDDPFAGKADIAGVMFKEFYSP